MHLKFKSVLLSVCLVISIRAEEVEYVKCEHAEIAIKNAPGNTCVPLTVHRILRDHHKLLTYEKIFKDLETDAEGAEINKSLLYLRQYCTLNAVYVRDDDFTKKFISDTPADFTFTFQNKPMKYKFLWVGMYNGGCHMAICYLNTEPLPDQKIAVEYRLSHSGRIHGFRVENILTPEEFFNRTMGLWEITDHK